MSRQAHVSFTIEHRASKNHTEGSSTQTWMTDTLQPPGVWLEGSNVLFYFYDAAISIAFTFHSLLLLHY
jgi:hypothetical protein